LLLLLCTLQSFGTSCPNRKLQFFGVTIATNPQVKKEITENKKLGQGKVLTYIPPISKDGKVYVNINEEDLMVHMNYWQNSLIGGAYELLAKLVDWVEYDWKPKFCGNYLRFGHQTDECRVCQDKPPEEEFNEGPSRKRRNEERLIIVPHLWVKAQSHP
ncbi:hypothetical protein MTR67_001868, partial [Solanum verrucosum]